MSGASPFLGENDNETYANITNVDYDFDDEFFKGISSQAKDFVSALLVKNPRFVYICSFLWSSFKEKKRGEERTLLRRVRRIKKRKERNKGGKKWKETILKKEKEGKGITYSMLMVDCLPNKFHTSYMGLP